MIGAIEGIGLALALFPLVVSILEHYEEGYDALSDWVFFRRKFTHLVNELNREQIIFRQMVERMLRSIIDSEFELEEMMENTQSDEWKNPDLALKMKRKLSGDGEYENYQSSLQSIHEHLDIMAKKLNSCRPPDDTSGVASQKGLRLQKKFRKLQFILRNKKWQDSVVDLGRQIDRVDKLFRGAEKLEPARKVRVAQTFGRTKHQASSLHTAIRKGWTCTCDKPHSFKLVIAKSPRSTAIQKTYHSVLQVVLPARPHFEANQVKSVSNTDAWDTFDTIMIKPSSDSSLSRCKSQGGDSYSSEIGSVGTTLVSTMPTETTITSSLASPDWACSTQVPSRRKSSTSTFTITESTTPIDNLCTAIQTRGNEACLGFLDDGQGSYHLFHMSSSVSFASAEIGGVVSLNDILGHNIHQPDEPRHQGGSDKVLVAPALSRRVRMSIALTLAYAILELYPTPWLPEFFSKTHIYFFQQRDGNIIAEHPFLICEALSAKADCQAPQPPPALTGEDGHMSALLALGILIMELWFGQTIESLSFWRDHCDDKGRVKKFTSLTAALEWQKKTKDEAGITLHQITLRCIRGNFGVTSMNLDNMNCVQAVYDQVVRPLEGFLGHF
ncbi:hypothetical protein DV737_g3446, partial [Chaetothyriales sp. CBS 132003]